MYIVLANVVALFHLLYVLVVIVVVPLVLIGRWRGWGWVRNFWFRLAHLLMIGVVVLEVACGWECPLTMWERELRVAGGQLEYKREPDGNFELGADGKPGTRYFPSYETDFIVKLMNNVFYFDPKELSPVVLNTIYVVFGSLVLAMLILVPPRWPWLRAVPTPPAAPQQT
jgi:hypothetical protein